MSKHCRQDRWSADFDISSYYYNELEDKTKHIKTSCQLNLSVRSDLPLLINRTDYIKINKSKNLTLICLLPSSDKTYDKENNAVGFLCLHT